MMQSKQEDPNTLCGRDLCECPTVDEKDDKTDKAIESQVRQLSRLLGGRLVLQAVGDGQIDHDPQEAVC